jgi:hypothetical protein
MRSADAQDFEANHFANRGVVGDLITLLCELSKRGAVENATRGKDSTFKETRGDLPTQPGTLTCSIIPLYSKPRLFVMGFHGSLNCGLSEGEPMAEDDTDAQDSDEAHSTGGWSWKECDVECGESVGLNCW